MRVEKNPPTHHGSGKPSGRPFFLLLGLGNGVQ